MFRYVKIPFGNCINVYPQKIYVVKPTIGTETLRKVKAQPKSRGL